MSSTYGLWPVKDVWPNGFNRLGQIGRVRQNQSNVRASFYTQFRCIHPLNQEQLNAGHNLLYQKAKMVKESFLFFIFGD